MGKKKLLVRMCCLRDVGECTSQVVADGVDVIPLFFGHGWAHVVGRHLSLVEEPLKYEERRCEC